MSNNKVMQPCEGVAQQGQIILGPTNTPTSKTTVVIITHNYGRFLAWCVHSVYAQTLQPTRVIIVDDASEDGTGELVSSLPQLVEYYRVEYRNAQKTRNFGLAKVVSEYVIFLDADDYMADRMIEQLEPALDEHPSVRLAYCDKYVFGDPASIRKLNLPYYWAADDFSLQLLQFKNFITTSTTLIRRKFLIEFDEHICRLQDWDTWLSILKMDEHAIRVPEPLLHYRAHGNNLSVRRQELIERLKIMTKHGLIEIGPLKTDSSPNKLFSRHQEIVVFTMSSSQSNTSLLHALSEKFGCRVRAIVGIACKKNMGAQTQGTIIRAKQIIIQTVVGSSLEDLLRRHAGVSSAPNVAIVLVAGDITNSLNTELFQPSKAPVLHTSLDQKAILDSSCFEELGAFTLSPAAIRLLHYMKPANPETNSGRVRRLFTRFWSEHIAWRLRR